MPTISIIVPVYNAEKHLRRCIDSILAQTFQDFELILVDDGSTDGSPKICDDYAKRDSRIKVFHKENGGVSAARNIGLEKANGHWIMFVDSDDTIPKDALERLYREGHAKDVDLVMAGYKKIDQEGTLSFSNEKHLRVLSTKSDLLLQMFCPTEYPYWGYVWSKLFRREIVSHNQIKFDEQIFFNEDRLFCVEYICNMRGDGRMLLESCYNYHENSASAMSSLDKQYNPKFVTGFLSYLKMYEMVKAMGPSKRLQTSIEEGIENAYLWNMSLMKRHDAYDSHVARKMQKELHKSHLFHRVIIMELKNYMRKMLWLLFPSIAVKHNN